jgi:hypothetical protein
MSAKSKTLELLSKFLLDNGQTMDSGLAKKFGDLMNSVNAQAEDTILPYEAVVYWSDTYSYDPEDEDDDPKSFIVHRRVILPLTDNEYRCVSHNDFAYRPLEEQISRAHIRSGDENLSKWIQMCTAIGLNHRHNIYVKSIKPFEYV